MAVKKSKPLKPKLGDMWETPSGRWALKLPGRVRYFPTKAKVKAFYTLWKLKKKGRKVAITVPPYSTRLYGGGIYSLPMRNPWGRRHGRPHRGSYQGTPIPPVTPPLPV